jgi:ribosome maturation protein SDO1
VCYARYKVNGKKFEAACYKNKVMNWKSGVETDIDEVLQIDRVFVNVSKGQFASSKELLAAFGTADEEQVLRTILDKGEFQLAGLERQSNEESMFRDIATLVADMCVNPETNRKYPVNTVMRNMKEEIHYALSAKNAKQQALEVIKELSTVMDIERAKMLVKIKVPSAEAESTREALLGMGALVDREGCAAGCASVFEFECRLLPQWFRPCSDLVDKVRDSPLVVAHSHNPLTPPGWVSCELPSTRAHAPPAWRWCA